VRIGLDTNILVYADGFNGEARRDQALAVLRRLPRGDIVVPVQCFGEFFNVLARKGRRPPTEVRAAVAHWQSWYAAAPTNRETMLQAVELALDHRLAIWDAVVCAACAEAGCRLLLSEDLQDGFTWSGVTVANPFAERRHPLLEALLA